MTHSANCALTRAREAHAVLSALLSLHWGQPEWAWFPTTQIARVAGVGHARRALVSLAEAGLVKSASMHHGRWSITCTPSTEAVDKCRKVNVNAGPLGQSR